jgi:DNA-binding MarR family transcriptional regulator
MVAVRAILACVKATVVSPKDLAGELLDLWSHLMRGSSQQMFAVLGELDLTMTQMKTLSMLDDCIEEVSVKELSERLVLSLPATSRTVDGLLRRGLLSRHEDLEDRRIKRVRLTDEGRKVVHRIVTARLQGLEAFATTLSDDQRAALMAALSDLPHKPDKKDPA